MVRPSPDLRSKYDVKRIKFSKDTHQKQEETLRERKGEGRYNVPEDNNSHGVLERARAGGRR